MNLKSTSSFTGKRMSGQSVTIPLVHLNSLALGSVQLNNPTVGVFDAFPPEMKEIGGIISLKAFEKQAFTYDYKNQQIILENQESLAQRIKKGAVVPIRLDTDGPSLGIHMPTELPDGSAIEVEVDTGSRALILDERFMSKLEVHGGLSALKRVDGKDETGHVYIRHFGKLKGSIRVKGVKEISQIDSSVQFQKIIYDGLVGDEFLRQFQVTYDLPHSRMIFIKN